MANKAATKAENSDIIIDSIFESAKVKKEKEQKEKESRKTEKPTIKEEKAAQQYTEDGLKIYKWEDLISSRGGDTDLCPFDCDCCY